MSDHPHGYFSTLVYEPFVDFLNETTNRMGGLFTHQQLLAGFCCLFPFYLFLQINGLYGLLFVPVGVGIVWGMAPAEGTVQYQLWLQPLQAALFPQVMQWRPWRGLALITESTPTLVYVPGADGQAQIAISLMPEKPTNSGYTE